MQNSLEAAMVDVMAEMDLCTQLKATLEQRMGKVHDKQGLNDARLQVGASGPRDASEAPSSLSLEYPGVRANHGWCESPLRQGREACLERNC